jgi:hypothetical protein
MKTQTSYVFFIYVYLTFGGYTSIFAQDFTFKVRSSAFKSVKDLNRHISTYSPPVLIDRKVLKDQIQRLQSGLQALTHMTQMIGEEHACQALYAQIESLKVSIAQLQTTLNQALIINSLRSTSSSSTPTKPSIPQVKKFLIKKQF